MRNVSENSYSVLVVLRASKTICTPKFATPSIQRIARAVLSEWVAALSYIHRQIYQRFQNESERTNRIAGNWRCWPVGKQKTKIIVKSYIERRIERNWILRHPIRQVWQITNTKTNNYITNNYIDIVPHKYYLFLYYNVSGALKIFIFCEKKLRNFS